MIKGRILFFIIVLFIFIHRVQSDSDRDDDILKYQNDFPSNEFDIVAVPSYASLQYTSPCDSADQSQCKSIYQMNLQVIPVQFRNLSDLDILKNVERLFKGDGDSDNYYLPPKQPNLQFDNFKYFLTEQQPFKWINLTFSQSNNASGSVNLKVANSSDGVVVNYMNQTVISGFCDKDGFFEVQVLTEISGYKPGDMIGYTVQYQNVQKEGQVFLVGKQGLTAIFDIDETLKYYGTGFQAIQSLLFRKYIAFIGLPPIINKWYQDAFPLPNDTFSAPLFFYLSAGPWPMAPSIEKFLIDNNLPLGPIQITRFDTNLSKFKNWFQVFSLLKSDITKLDAFTTLYNNSPYRTFLLSGDTAMKDPEFEGQVMRNSTYAHNIALSLIRKVPIVNWRKNSQERLNEAFKNVPKEKWIIYENITTLQSINIRQLILNNTAIK